MNIPISFHLSFIICLMLTLAQKEASSKVSDLGSYEIGEQIYNSGIGEGEQKIVAILSGREIPASMMACANCHGPCGKGVTLQGIDIPDIRRQHYADRYMKDVSPAKVEKTINSNFKKAIALGKRYDGEPIHNMMPRYRMSLKDMDHLLAYLAVLGEDEKCSKAK